MTPATPPAMVAGDWHLHFSPYEQRVSYMPVGLEAATKIEAKVNLAYGRTNTYSRKAGVPAMWQ